MARELKIQPSSQKVIGFLLIVGFLLALGLYYIPRRPAFSDEMKFHLPLAQQFYQTPVLQVVLGDEYAAANTPLPYIVSVGLIKIAGITPDIYILRIINLSVYVLAVIVLFYGFLKRDIWILIIVAFNVYLLKSAVLYYMADWGILFFCTFLILLRCNKDLYKPVTLFLLVLASLFAIMSQQFYMILPVAFLFGALIQNDYKVNAKLLPAILVVCAVLLLPSLLFLKWGGLTHKNFSGFNPVAFAPTNITAILAIVGFNLSPYILYKVIKERKFYWIPAVAALVFGVFLTPRYEHYMYEGAIVGITFRVIDAVAMHSEVGTRLIASCFVYLGMLTLYEVVRIPERSIEIRVQQIAVLLFSILYVFTSHIGERHMVPMVFLLYLMLLPRLENRKILYIWAAVQFAIGVIYVNHLFHDLSII